MRTSFPALRKRPKELTFTRARISTGILGLDDILKGGVLPLRSYLIRGKPGTGKTLFGFHFLVKGATDGEPVLFVSFAEPDAQLRSEASTLGLTLDRFSILDLTPAPKTFKQLPPYDIFSPSEVEREPLLQQIARSIEIIKPRRIFFDSMLHFRYAASDTFQFRRLVQSFIRFAEQHGATALLSSEESALFPDDDLQFICDGVIHLELHDDERILTVLKFRGSDFRPGRNIVRVTSNGMEVRAG